MREYLMHKTHPDIQLHLYVQNASFKKTFIDRMTRDGFKGPQCWYKAMARNYQHECVKLLPGDRDRVKVPVLCIGCKDDAVCRPEALHEYQERATAAVRARGDDRRSALGDV
jgi:soluble epoxide hydrolase/lipid-phosphate phosphatase